jgi:peptidoglycan/LPS O-acetylase OafA/YrhL
VTPNSRSPSPPSTGRSDLFASRRLADVCGGRDNNLNLIRFLAAVAVIYGHCYGLRDRNEAESFYRLFGMGTGSAGVNIFFFISGFLIGKSFSSKSFTEYAWARFVRIYPGLWASVLLTVLVAGLFFSPLPAREFWLGRDTLAYVAHNTTMLPGFGARIELPHALEGATGVFNTSLWTLPHELQMYVLLAAIGLVGGLRRPFIAAAVLAIGAGAVIARKLFGLNLLDVDRARFLYFFFAGTFAYLARKRITLSVRGVLLAAAVVLLVVAATGRRDLRQGALAAVLPYLLLWAAYVPAGFIRRFNQLGDYSYGVYIYAFPIQVCLFGTRAGAESIPNFLLTTLIVVPIAVASWHLVEKRALQIPVPPFLARLSLGASKGPPAPTFAEQPPDFDQPRS